MALCINGSLNAQSKANIENIDFTVEGVNLVITYDIVKYKSDEVFNIWVKIVTASGKEIIPNTMTGDVGSGVIGGSGKRIMWDMETDNAYIDEEISVQVLARSPVCHDPPAAVPSAVHSATLPLISYIPA